MMGHRIKPLDGIRGLAILFVIAFHTFNTALSVSPGELHFRIFAARIDRILWVDVVWR